MRRAVEALLLPADFLFIDGNQPVSCDVPQETLVGGRRPVRLDRGRVDLGEGVAGPDDDGVRPALPGVRPLRAQGVSDAGAPGGDPPLGTVPIHRRTFRGVVLDLSAGGSQGRGRGGRSGLAAISIGRGSRSWRGTSGRAAARLTSSRARGDVLVFVEVRSREDAAFGTPEESVTLAKRRRIVAAETMISSMHR